MPLKLRPSGLGSGIDKDRPDYTVYTGQWDIGRIYQTRGGPDSLRWFWSMNANGPMTRSDRVATLEEAKAQFQEELGRLEGRERSWKRLLTSLSLLARLPHWRRFFENLLRGVAPLRRGRYHRGWSNICGRNGGLGNDVIGDFGDTSAQSQEAKRCVLRLKS
jgi:hypothetical protein